MSKNGFWIVFGVLVWVSTGMAAFEISPIVMTLAPSGTEASISLTITNTGDQKAPIQITVVARDPDIDGNEKYVETDEVSDMFQIIPAQFVLNSKEKRTVRLTYVGDPKIKNELAFRLITEEFPINITEAIKVTTKAVASISIISKYVTSLYVKPQGTKPEIVIEAKHNKDKKMELIIKNTGSEHFVIQKGKYKVITTKDSIKYDLPQELADKIGTQNILAGKSKKVVIPWPAAIPVVPVKLVLESSQK